MDRAVVLSTWMLHLGDLNEVLNEHTWKVSVNCKNITFYETLAFVLHISKLLSLFRFILSKTNRKIMHLLTWTEKHCCQAFFFLGK